MFVQKNKNSKDKSCSSFDSLAKKYEHFRAVIWFSIGYTAAILMSFMNIWWK